MKKNKYVLIAASIVFAFLITSCGANNEQIIDDMSEESTMSMDDSSNVAENYEEYSGFWSVDGKTQDEVIASEGATLSCEIIDSNMFSGSLYTQQDISERFANVDNIEGTIENGKLYCDFEDDGWGGQGTLYIQFSDNQIKVEVLDYQMAEDNMTGYGISGNYIFMRSEASSASDNENDEAYQSMSEEELLQRVNERSTYYLASAYHDEVVDYWENVREATDITNVTEPLYDTDKMYYSSDDFSNDPPVILHLAKNEIYARRGYIFKDEDLNNYFMGCVWYQPLYNSDEFDDAIFNEYEKQNLELLSVLDAKTINSDDDKVDYETGAVLRN